MIRAITGEEIGECVEVIRKSFATVAAEFGLTAQNAPRFTAFAVTSQRLEQQFYQEHRPMFAFFRQDVIVGYYSLLPRGASCELNNLCVLPEYRHQGIGEALLSHACKTARGLGCPKIELGLVEENRQLRSWYESLGFTHTGTKKFDFFPFTCGYMEKQL